MLPLERRKPIEAKRLKKVAERKKKLRAKKQAEWADEDAAAPEAADEVEEPAAAPKAAELPRLRSGGKAGPPPPAPAESKGESKGESKADDRKRNPPVKAELVEDEPDEDQPAAMDDGDERGPDGPLSPESAITVAALDALKMPSTG